MEEVSYSAQIILHDAHDSKHVLSGCDLIERVFPSDGHFSTNIDHLCSEAEKK